MNTERVSGGAGEESTLSHVLDNSRDILYRMDLRNRRYDYMSPAVERITGYSLEEVKAEGNIGLGIKIHPDDLERVANHLIEISGDSANDGVECTIEYRLKCSDGSYKWLSDNHSVVMDEGGFPRYIVGNIRDVTQSRKAQAALRESEERYRLIIENQTEIVVKLDPEGRILFASPSYRRLFGQDVESLHGESFVPMLHESTRSEMQEAFAKVFSSPYIAYAEEYSETTNGWRWIGWTGKAVVRIDGTVDSIIAVGRDITDRKMAEEELRRSEEQFRAMIEHGTDIIYVVNMDGTIRYASPSAERILGYSNEELVGKIGFDFVHPDDLNEIVSIFQDSMDNPGRPKTVECRCRHKDGSWLVFETTSGNRFRELSIDGFILNSRDITERKRMQLEIEKHRDHLQELVSERTAELEKTNEALVQEVAERINAEKRIEEERNYAQNLIDSSLDMIISVDQNRNIVGFNKAAQRVFGYDENEALGSSVSILYDDPDEVKKVHVENILRGHFVGEIRNRRKNGETFPAFLSSSRLSDTNGNFIGYMGISRDITREKEAREALRKSKIEAEAANRMKSEFLANMSHEIRTPMNGVIGMTGLLLDTELDTEQRQYAEMARKSAESLMRIINDILDFSKIESGKLEMEEMDFDLCEVMEDFSEIMALRAHGKGLEYICSVDPSIPMRLTGDPGRLRQLLTNLVDNAVKFTEDGEVSVSVILVDDKKDRVKLRFDVNDTGIGMPMDRLDILFDAFTQVDASISRNYGGTGLGLAISKKIAEMMNGTIAVETEPGKGSDFWFTAEFKKQQLADGSEFKPDKRISGSRILVVDDNRSTLEMISRCLGAWGCECVTMADPEEALEKYTRMAEAGAPADIVIIDRYVRNMSGDWLARKISAIPGGGGTMIMMSAQKMIDLTKLEESGFCTYISKPVRQTQLYRKVLQALNLECELTEASSADRFVSAGQRPGPEKVRILLAEDNATNQLVAISMLRKFGFRVDAVASGIEVVSALETTPYDLVLMDVQMPEMDGFEATRIIRNKKSNVLKHDVPVIAMTAHAMKGYRESCLDVGMDDYISKPVNPDELARVLDKWIPDSAGTDLKRGGESAAQEHVVYDRKRLLQRLGGDEDFVKELAGIFLKDLSEKLKEMKAALAEGDAERTRRLAHTMKGASANVEAVLLRESFREIEEGVEKHGIEAAEGKLDKIEVMLQDFRSALAGAGDLEKEES